MTDLGNVNQNKYAKEIEKEVTRIVSYHNHFMEGGDTEEGEIVLSYIRGRVANWNDHVYLPGLKGMELQRASRYLIKEGESYYLASSISLGDISACSIVFSTTSAINFEYSGALLLSYFRDPTSTSLI